MKGSDPIALGLSLSWWYVLPFAGILLAVALLPVFAPNFWGRHFGKVSLAFGLPVAGYFLNPPNFMVRAIAEEGGVRMPSFFGYMAWSFAVLLPVFGLITLIFF